MSCCLRVERAANGYVVRCDDPKIIKENAKPASRYKDPTREYVFTTCEDVCAFITKNIDKALPADDYETSFDMAVDKGED